LLLSRGAQVREPYLSRTPLHWAAELGGPALLDDLVARGADVDARDNRGRTPLYIAAICGNSENAARLLALGANARIPDELGRIPLHAACIANRESTVELLLRPRDCVVFDSFGVTPLHMATRGPSPILAMMLESMRAAPAASLERVLNMQTVSGKTILHFAVQSRSDAAALALARLGARRDIEDSFGRTPANWWKPWLRRQARASADPESAPAPAETQRNNSASALRQHDLSAQAAFEEPNRLLVSFRVVEYLPEAKEFIGHYDSHRDVDLWSNGTLQYNTNNRESQCTAAVSRAEISALASELCEVGAFDIPVRKFVCSGTSEFLDLRFGEKRSFSFCDCAEVRDEERVEFLEYQYFWARAKQVLADFCARR
jgi:ankyrin repeat protein